MKLDSLFKELENALEDDKDPIGKVRILALKAGLKAAEMMEKYPDLTEPCIELLISHMNIYAELVLLSSSINGIDVPEEEEELAQMLSSITVMGEA